MTRFFTLGTVANFVSRSVGRQLGYAPPGPDLCEGKSEHVVKYERGSLGGAQSLEQDSKSELHLIVEGDDQPGRLPHVPDPDAIGPGYGGAPLSPELL